MRKRKLQLTLTVALLRMASWAWADEDRDRKSADLFSSTVAWTWFEQLYDTVKAERTTPPPASRVYGSTAVALYESLVDGTRKNRSLVGQLSDLDSVPRPSRHKDYHWPTVANAVLADTIRGLYPTISQASLDAINGLEQSHASQFAERVSRNVYERSVAHGRAVAAAILDWASTDGFSTFDNCAYVPAPVAGAWEPTPPSFSPNRLQPCWGFIRQMVMAAGECPPPVHPAFSTAPSSEFYAAGQEVYAVGLGLTVEQKMIADYWSDGPGATGTPPGHWMAIVSQIARNDDLSLAAAAEAYARVGIAVHDAFIACWDAKYIYNLQRPVTYINEHFDAAWLPYIVTPVFPAYTSGHSTQSGAAATVLTDLFGAMKFKDTTHIDHGLVPPQEPRRFWSFDEAAAEAAVSRLYGGIHYTFDHQAGLASGQCIGRTISERVDFKRQGHGRGRDDD